MLETFWTGPLFQAFFVDLPWRFKNGRENGGPALSDWTRGREQLSLGTLQDAKTLLTKLHELRSSKTQAITESIKKKAVSEGRPEQH